MSAARDGALDCESASAEAGKGADTHVAMEREIGKERTERRSIGFSGGDVDMETSTEDCLCEAPHDVLKDKGTGRNATEPPTRAQSIANTRGGMFIVAFGCVLVGIAIEISGSGGSEDELQGCLRWLHQWLQSYS